MKTKLLVFTMFLIGFTCYSQNTYVPDDVFEQFLIDSGYDSGSLDDYVPTANINTVTFLEIQFYDIADLTGIEGFSALEVLRCNYLKLTSLDLSQNTALTYLDCIDNQITSLDLSQNTALTSLDCQSNQLTTLNVSQNTLLKNLYCQGNLLTSLDVSQNTALTNLECDGNDILSLDVSQNTLLEFLYCTNNNLSSLDVSGNNVLSRLYCDANSISGLDVSQNPDLIYLSCSNNNLTNLDVSSNTELLYLFCQDNQLTSLDLSQNTQFLGLYAENNDLTSLDIKNGNNSVMNINYFRTTGNPNLTCINVDNAAYSTANWTNIDSQSYFSENCGALGIDDVELLGFSMYPNPIYDVVTISINEEAVYSIFNLNGQALKNGKLSSGDNTLRTSQLSKGLYFLNIRTDRGFIFKKLMKN